MAINADILRRNFGFNDPNVIEGILRDPGQMARYEREYQGIISPGASTSAPASIQGFQEEERGRLAEFTGRLGKVPAELEAVRTAVGLPGAYATYGMAGETARKVAQGIQDIPGRVTEAAMGRDVSAWQLERMVAAKTLEAQPTLTEASRGLEAAGAGLQNIISQYGVEAANIFKPYEIEAGLLGDSMKSEFDLLKTQIDADLTREIENLRSKTSITTAELNRATELARVEQATKEGNVVDLGDRYGVFDYYGNLLKEIRKGKLTTLGAGGNEWEYV